MLPRINRERLAELERTDPAAYREAIEALEALERLRVENPLAFFKPHSDQQRAFFAARTRIVAAFAGNGFGKSTGLVGRALIEVQDRDALPEHLRQFKSFEAPVRAWILCPTEEKVYDSLQPAFEKWCPKSLFLGGSWGKAFNGQRMMLSFSNGSSIAFKTYKQDPSTLGGAELHFVGYDEPPPKAHRSECLARLRSTASGYEMYAMTPLKANTGWVKRDIFKQRESPDITVIRGSIHDNPTLDTGTKDFILSQFPEIERKAREFGDFLDFGGLMYPDFERCILKQPLDLEFVRSLDVVVGIDPGIRNAGFVWVGFDDELQAFVFNEGLLQDKEAPDYAKFIHAENRRLGLDPGRVEYVCDPAARERGKVNATTVLSALEQCGIHSTPGQNDHEAGFDQMRARMRHERLHVDPRCRGLRDEADDYASKEPEEGKDDSHLDPVKGNDHRLDALRYAVMERFWDPVVEEQAPDRNLGWRPGVAPAGRVLQAGVVAESHPLGSMT